MKPTPCPQEFKDFLKTNSILELVYLSNDLKRHPKDRDYHKAVQDELKSRHKEQ